MLGTEVLGDSMGGLGRLCNLPGEEPRKEGGSPKLGVQGRKEWRTLRGKGNPWGTPCLGQDALGSSLASSGFGALLGHLSLLGPLWVWLHSGLL